MTADDIIDLSHTIVPEKEEYGCQLEIKNIEEVFTSYIRAPESWYVIGSVTMNTHCGTHIEAPFHHVRTGADVASIPLRRLIGPAVCIDFSDFGNNDEVTLDDMIRRAANVVRKGDIVFLDCGVAKNFGTPKGHERPWFSTDAIKWLVDEKQIVCLGADATGVEVRTIQGGSTGAQPNHEYLLGNEIPLVESLTNLDKLHNRRFTALILPVKMQGADSFPARALALLEAS